MRRIRVCITDHALKRISERGGDPAMVAASVRRALRGCEFRGKVKVAVDDGALPGCRWCWCCRTRTRPGPL